MVTVGLLTVLVCGCYVLLEWARLNDAYSNFERLSSSGADLRALFVAESVQSVHRINCFAEGVGLLSLILAAIGLHGLSIQRKYHA